MYINNSIDSKIDVNKSKIHVLVFRKVGRRANDGWIYSNAEIQQINHIPYIRIVSTPGVTMTNAQKNTSCASFEGNFCPSKKFKSDYIEAWDVIDMFY